MISLKLVSELDNLNLESLLIIFFNATDQEDGILKLEVVIVNRCMLLKI